VGAGCAGDGVRGDLVIAAEAAPTGERGFAGWGGTHKNAAGGLLSTSGLIRCFHGS